MYWAVDVKMMAGPDGGCMQERPQFDSILNRFGHVSCYFSLFTVQEKLPLLKVANKGHHLDLHRWKKARAGPQCTTFDGMG